MQERVSFELIVWAYNFNITWLRPGEERKGRREKILKTEKSEGSWNKYLDAEDRIREQ